MTTHGLSAVLEFLNSPNKWSEALLTAAGVLAGWARNAFNDLSNRLNPAKQVTKEILKEMENFLHGIYENLAPDPDMGKEAWDKAQEANKSAQEELENVFTPAGETVQGALATGGIPAQTDGGLGQTHDNYTPQGDVPFNVGNIPGMGTDAVGPSHGSSDGGYGGGYSGSSGGGSSGGGSSGGGMPLGGSSGSPGAGTSGSPPDTGVTTMPTASDLGLDPGTYFEYQPTANQVQITYSDGSTETRPWPPQ